MYTLVCTGINGFKGSIGIAHAYKDTDLAGVLKSTLEVISEKDLPLTIDIVYSPLVDVITDTKGHAELTLSNLF